MSKRSEVIKKSSISNEQALRVARALLPDILSSWDNPVEREEILNYVEPTSNKVDNNSTEENTI